jgi:hypothetical protein
MSDAEFFAGLTGGQNDFARAVVALRATGRAFCLIGGLAINHYVEPVVTLDADFAVAASGGGADALRAAGFSVEEFPHSLNALFPGSRLRFQLTLKDRYGTFPSRASRPNCSEFACPWPRSKISSKGSSGRPWIRRGAPATARKTDSI